MKCEAKDNRANRGLHPVCMLMDNGSLRPQPTLRLRSIAGKLSAQSEIRVAPVSILHSNRVHPSKLEGERAEVAASFIDMALAAGERDFVCLPFFLGPSLALTEYLPQLFKERLAEHPDLRYVIADPIAGAQVTSPDSRMIEALARRVEDVIEINHWQRPAVALVDHGTPVRAVNQVREATADALAQCLGERVSAVKGFAMERKPGEDYAFNEPMLENLRDVPGFQTGPVVVAMFFLLEGRHAGPEGDVAAICADVTERNPQAGPIRMTALLGSTDWLVPLLADRLEAALRLR